MIFPWGRKLRLMTKDSVLLNDWHPVVTVAELGETPVLGTRLLDEDIVVWRAGEQVHAWRDSCVHRGTKLSLGKIINDDPHVTTRNFRPEAVPSPELVELELKWSPEELMQESAGCNGCGVCKTQDSELRMCPFFRIEPLEEASPRSAVGWMRPSPIGMSGSRVPSRCSFNRSKEMLHLVLARDSSCLGKGRTASFTDK